MTKGSTARNKLEEIKMLFKSGQIDYDQAKDMAKEPLKILNEEMEKIARKFGRVHKNVNFINFMR